MYNFRSIVFNTEKLKDMLCDKNEMRGTMFKMKEYLRITKVRKLIKKQA